MAAVWEHLADEAKKFVLLVLFVCAGLAGHYDVLPTALEPFKQWIEFAGFIGGLVNAWRIIPPPKKDNNDG